MAKFKFEYIWLDGYKPEPNLRSKTKVLDLDFFHGDINILPLWSFDGSSTQQAEGRFSDCILKPVSVYPDPDRINAFLVMCEVLNPDLTPHVSNYRSTFSDDEDYWFGFEQEYVLTDSNGLPLGFPDKGYPRPQGLYYCSVGTDNCAGREIVEEHFDTCLDAGLNITGINAEVLLGQWEFQLFGKGKRAADDLWVARYLLHRTTEKYGAKVEFHPKPIKGDWNGSGMHTNFSTTDMREKGGKKLFDDIFQAFRENHENHIKVYGSDNEQRLTGLHETQAIDTFSYGVSDRGASIRIPLATSQEWKGYLEDRRPASNADPYRVIARIMATLGHAYSNNGKSNGLPHGKKIQAVNN